jgi:hypothetical protein
MAAKVESKKLGKNQIKKNKNKNKNNKQRREIQRLVESNLERIFELNIPDPDLKCTLNNRDLHTYTQSFGRGSTAFIIIEYTRMIDEFFGSLPEYGLSQPYAQY